MLAAMTATDAAPIVSTAELHRQYGEGEAAVHALRGVSIAFPAGQFTAIMGPSGSGKSTLMHLLAGLDKPTSGSVVIDGQELSGLDETTFSREIAPLAGFYPSVYAGAPWWFLDAPDAIRRFRAAVTETAGLTRTSGFIDDTRAFCSIPARHDMARRLDSGYLAGLVAEHRLDEDEALDSAVRLVVDNPRAAFKL